MVLFEAIKVTQILEWISFLGLLAATTYSVKTVYNEYLEEKTYFSKSFEDRSEYDLPTVTLCINSQSVLNYGIDFHIKMETDDRNQTWLNLHKGEQEVVLKWDVRTVTFKRKVTLEQILPHREHYRKDYKTCVVIHQMPKISRDIVKEKWPLLGYFVLEIGNQTVQNLTDAKVYFTTKQNSFGAVMNRWFDGKAEPFLLERMVCKVFAITGVTRFEYLEGKCTNESYYQCLSTNLKLKMLRDCEEQCTTITLPKFGFSPCNNIKSKNCAINALETLHRGDECRETRLCKVQEYTVEEQKLNYPLCKNCFFFYVHFKDPKSSSGYRASKLMVNVYKENLVWSGFILIGNVGGQMGMFVGFSFSGCIGWTLRTFALLWNYIRRNALEK